MELANELLKWKSPDVGMVPPKMEELEAYPQPGY